MPVDRPSAMSTKLALYSWKLSITVKGSGGDVSTILLAVRKRRKCHMPRAKIHAVSIGDAVLFDVHHNPLRTHTQWTDRRQRQEVSHQRAAASLGVLTGTVCGLPPHERRASAAAR